VGADQFPAPEKVFELLKNPNAQNPYSKKLPDSVEQKLQAYILEQEYFMSAPQQYSLAHNYMEWLGKKNNRSKAFAIEQYGMACYNSSRVDTAKQAFQECVQLYQNLKDTTGLARSYSMLGTLAEIRSEYPVSIYYQTKAYSLFQEIGDTTEMMDCQIELAYLLGKDNQFVLAEKLLKDAETYFEEKKDSVQLCGLLYTLAEVYGQNNKFVEAENYCDKSLRMRIALKDSMNLSICYNYFGYIYMTKKEWNKSIQMFDKAIEIRIKNGMTEEPVIIYNLATCLSKMNEYDKAIAYLNRSIYLAQNNPEYLNTKSLAFNILAEIYAESGQYEKALEARTTFEILKDSVDKMNDLMKVRELSLRFQNQEKEKLLNASIQRAEQERNFNVLLITASGIIIILLLLTLYLVRLQNKKNVELKERQIRSVQKELELRQEQLISFTQQLTDRSRIIQELEAGMQGKATPVSEPEDEHAFEQLLQMKILTEEDWRVFRIQFEQVFPGVMMRLHARFPFLTGAEQRIFLLIRLCSDTKEIADLLGISSESVRKAKYRLKKKLELGENVAIDEFIRKF
jgi:tetratricopeptide (TPR) repeat protein